MLTIDRRPMPFHPASAKPLYAQVRDLMLTRVRAGEWSAGEALPNEFVLASEFVVSIGTVRRAVAELEAIGVLLRKQGRGTFVAGPGGAALQEKFTRLRLAGGERFTPTYTLLSVSRRPANDAERVCLGGEIRHGIIEVVQLVERDGNSLGIETSALPATLFPRFETQFRFGQHLYPVLADYGCLVTRVDETIGMAAGGASVATRLGCTTGCSLLAIERTANALDGIAVEWRTALYRAALVRYASGGC